MSDNSDRVGSFLVAGLLIGALIMAAAHGLPNWDWSAKSWFGEKPILDYLLGFITVAAALFAGTVALHSFRMNVDAGHAARFQKGVELLAGSSTSSVAGGLEVLADVSRLRPGIYHRPVMRVLAVHIAETSNAGWTAVMTNTWDKAEHSTRPTVGAFRAVSIMNEVMNLEGAVPNPVSDRFWRPYLHLVRFDGYDFRQATFTTMAAGMVMFGDCKFLDCNFEMLAAADLVEWEKCTFISTTITTMKGSRAMEFRDNNFQGLTINGRVISEDGSY